MDAPDFDLSFNESAWGPSATLALPEDALNATVSKSDRLYLFVNFLAENRGAPRKPVAGAGGPSGAAGPAVEGGASTPVAVEDNTGFVVKDSVTAPTYRPGGGGNRGPRPYTGPRPGGGAGGPQRNTGGGGGGGRGGGGLIDKTSKTRPREASVQIAEDWELIESFEVPALNKLAANIPSAPEDLKWTGRLGAYDDKMDKVSVRLSKPLTSQPDKVHFYTRVKQDPAMMELAMAGAGKVFVSDTVLVHLMSCTKTAYPWDIIFFYLGGIIFIDVRDQAKFEQLTVHETAVRQPAEDADPLNGSAALAEEATRIQQEFSQQVVAATDKTEHGAGAAALKLDIDVPEYWNPAEYPGKAHANVAYRYRKWELSGGVPMVVRSSVSAYDVAKKKVVNCFALNEWDHKDTRAVNGSLPWRASLDTRRGQVLGSEIKNNNAKFTRWMMQTMLSGADEMRVGFVSRNLPSNRTAHTILGVQNFTPSQATQMFNVNQNNMWGIVKWAIDLVKTHAAAKRGDTPDDEFVAKFILVKDPNRAVVSLYSIDPSLYEPDEAEDEEEGEEDKAE